MSQQEPVDGLAPLPEDEMTGGNGAEAPFPSGIRYVSIYSRSDGIVDWRSCLDPAAEHVEVDASHIGMAVSVPVYRAVAAALAAASADELPLAA